MLKFYPSWYSFFTLNMLGLFLLFSSCNWYMIWIGFELSLMGFIPMFSVSSSSVESMVLYFLVQTSGSSLYLLSNLSGFFSPNFSFVLFALSMMLKLGLFPFLQWVPIMMAKMSWVSCTFLATVQKLNPLLVVFLDTSGHSCWAYCGVLSALIGAVVGCNQVFLRPLMGYSSISHSGYLTIMAGGSWINLLSVYFSLYSGMVALLFWFFHKNNSNKVMSKTLKGGGLISMLLISLAGIPPFPLFFLKIMVMVLLVNSGLGFLLGPLVLAAFISVYLYLNLIIPSSLLH